jgi:hypothetical protein
MQVDHGLLGVLRTGAQVERASATTTPQSSRESRGFACFSYRRGHRGRPERARRPGLRKGPCQERVSAPTASFMVSATLAGSSTSVMRRS